MTLGHRAMRIEIVCANGNKLPLQRSSFRYGILLWVLWGTTERLGHKNVGPQDPLVFCP
jgi:hypothetical protein